jgi:hypothetical protein
MWQGWVAVLNVAAVPVATLAAGQLLNAICKLF